MHYANLVIVEKPEDGNVKQAVEEAMRPGKESWWDWYQIGGRWTGAFDGYDPDKDEANQEECNLCAGTGVRRDAVGVANGMPERSYCNGCSGKGKRVTWPTQWRDRDGDIVPVESLTAESYEKFYRIVNPYGHTWGDEDYLPWKEAIEEKFTRREKPPLEWLKKEYAGHLAVVVDNHN